MMPRSLLVVSVVLALCLAAPSTARAQAPNGDVLYAYAVLAERPGGGTVPLARVVIEGAGQPCPTLSPGDVGMVARTNPNPETFDVTICEALYEFDQAMTVDGTRLGLPPVTAEPRRIVVMGDTGCGSTQGCSSPETWPFGAFASAAAKAAPDLVIHVGDYNYRTPGSVPVNGVSAPVYDAGDGLPIEDRCLSPEYPYVSQNVPRRASWDSWSAWREQFFVPAEPLLAAAPWVVARGNHELCSRAGPGYFYFLDPHSRLLGEELSCPVQRDGDDPLPYLEFVPPYRLDLGALRLVVIDSANACDLAVNYAKTYERQFGVVRELLGEDRPAWFVTHRPMWGVDRASASPHRFEITNATLEAALRGSSLGGSLPKSVQLVLSGHIHRFESVTFEPDSERPPQLIIGDSGIELADTPLSGEFATSVDGEPATGLAINEFGYLRLRLQPDGSWEGRVVDPRQSPPSVIATCGTPRLKATGRLCVPGRLD